MNEELLKIADGLLVVADSIREMVKTAQKVLHQRKLGRRTIGKKIWQNRSSNNRSPLKMSVQF